MNIILEDKRVKKDEIRVNIGDLVIVKDGTVYKGYVIGKRLVFVNLGTGNIWDSRGVELKEDCNYIKFAEFNEVKSHLHNKDIEVIPSDKYKIKVILN